MKRIGDICSRNRDLKLPSDTPPNFCGFAREALDNDAPQLFVSALQIVWHGFRGSVLLVLSSFLSHTKDTAGFLKRT
ncbi:hypothetical protein HZH66_001295 [Vespula vulgaris]|uniref:Uncharacterized protein n=1 Tax=Vespula vulgaris TaxID=7454 RepID=A0A834NLI8_VESVU|nr:hypothetical protein HZH66_001295 [Vespula vulgaris]